MPEKVAPTVTNLTETQFKPSSSCLFWRLPWPFSYENNPDTLVPAALSAGPSTILHGSRISESGTSCWDSDVLIFFVETSGNPRMIDLAFLGVGV